MCHILTTFLCGFIFAVIFENKCNQSFVVWSNCNETEFQWMVYFFQCDRSSRIDSRQRIECAQWLLSCPSPGVLLNRVITTYSCNYCVKVMFDHNEYSKNNVIFDKTWEKLNIRHEHARELKVEGSKSAFVGVRYCDDDVRISRLTRRWRQLPSLSRKPFLSIQVCRPDAAYVKAVVTWRPRHYVRRWCWDAEAESDDSITRRAQYESHLIALWFSSSERRREVVSSIVQSSRRTIYSDKQAFTNRPDRSTGSNFGVFMR